eukprot:GDKK01053027.1.p1 GENE.GDKK01053027.1~~GDKK01053027.1.p1  ORF type:complete len:344 (-),score=63.21 GDKK01053027.1:179-1177(-)
MIALLSTFVVLGLAASVSARRIGNNLAVTRQDVNGKGVVQKYDITSGMPLGEDGPSFTFTFPHVEMTSDSNTGNIYVVTFPVDAPGPVLFQLDRDLSTNYTWNNVPYSFFDLQFSPAQDTLYGIKVTTTYGRVLSNFVVDQASDSVTATELYTLPYMWYVNASSFDPANNRYFALINNFPGFENSTLDQQLIVADFSGGAANLNPSVGLFPISSGDMLVQFVTYAHSLKTLFCAGFAHRQAQVAIMDQTNGAVTKVVFSVDAVAVGPLMYIPNKFGKSELTVYVQTARGAAPVWQWWALTPAEDGSGAVSARLIDTYTGNYYTYFDGAAVAY